MEKRPYFILLGGNMLCRGICEKLQFFGYKVLVVDWNACPAVRGDEHWQMDVKDAAGILQALEKSAYDIDGAFTCIDLAVPTVNAIHRRYHRALMPEAFDTVLTKARMRAAWQQAGIFNRYSKTYEPSLWNEIKALNSEMKLIVKPNVAASSRGITILEKCSDDELLQAAIAKAANTSFDKQCLIEEFVEGREFTVDMLGDEENVSVYAISVKYHSANTNHNRVAVKLHWNSNVYPDEVYERIAARAKECYRALGMKNCYGHLEIIMKADGSLSPVEIGARTSGYIGSHLVSKASHCDYIEDYLRVIHGERIPAQDHINSDSSSMWFGYDFPDGAVAKRNCCLADFLPAEVEVLAHKRDALQLGRRFAIMQDDNGRDDAGFEMLAAPKSVLTIELVEEAERHFLRHFLSENEQ